MRKTLGLFFIGIFAFAPIFGYAASSSLQQTIDDKNDEIEKLQSEIDHYQDQVAEVQDQAQTLQSALATINQSQKKLQSQITLTNKKIDRANLTIKKNEEAIGNLGEGIISSTTALKETIRSLNQSDNQSIIELLASGGTVSDFLRDIDDVIEVQKTLKTHVITMKDTRFNLQNAQVELAKQKEEHQKLLGELADQKKIVDAQVAEKNQLLAETKNQESQYQAILADRKARVAALEAEIFNYESQLKFTLNEKGLPGKGALAWPLKDVLITQAFGKTVAAKRLYVSGSHSGIDFRASTGTAVYAAADGVVEGIGDTDRTCPKASFGKWVFIRHNNGLATVYAHLSLIKAVEGQKVRTGDLIAYSGNTGHSTAPHLHLTVMASNGVNGEEGARVDSKPSASCNGKVYRMPIAPTSAYLDPLLYLPKTTPNLFKDGLNGKS
jgi:murein DD-endopeptidase MepM/ murein hydrolase activator NlpD